MAYRYTVADLKRTTIRNIAGVCLDSTGFFETLNEVQRRLLRRGKWDDVEWLVKLCVYDRCITWPRYVKTVLGARLCDGRMVEIKNGWYSILDGALSLNPSPGKWIWGVDCGVNDLALTDNGRGPTYRDIPGTTGRNLRYYVKYQNDIGKTITIYGKAYGGQTLQHQDANGDYVDGLVITAAAPYGTSSVLVTEIDSVVRDATQGPGYLYCVDPTDATETLLDLAVYEPSETNPRYRKTLVDNFCSGPICRETTTVDSTDYTRNRMTIAARVKLDFPDLANDADFIAIDNFEVYKMGFQAVKLEEANDDAAAEVKWIKAVRELNYDIRDMTPESQTPVFVNVVNGSAIYNPI